MPTTAPEKTVPRANGVAPDAVRIGADIVELLTSGMYVSPITVFREYVQNSADAIDAARTQGLLKPEERGTVAIQIDHTARSVTIRDNGAGILGADVQDVLLAIGGSTKRGTGARGFRGVGRLSGLAYCRELEFRTKAAGETVETIVVWNCRELRSGIAAARSGTDLRDVIANAVTITSEAAADATDHFFQVTLREPARHRQDILLNERAIAHYLGQVAPVAFSSEFSWASEIEDRLAQLEPNPLPIDLTIDGEPVYRPYKTIIVIPGTDKTISIGEIEFFELADVDGEVGAIGWIGHHEYVRSIPTGLGIRGLRARVGNIQIGERSLFDEVFKEPRFNGWTIGELHVLDPRIIPNGRRDNFEVNHHSYNLLVQLGPIAARLATRCRTTSVNRNASLIISNTIKEVEGLLEAPRLEAIQISRARAAVGRCVLKLKGVLDGEEKSGLGVRLDALELALMERRPSKKAGIIASDEAIALVGRIVTNREQARQLIGELRQLEG